MMIYVPCDMAKHAWNLCCPDMLIAKTPQTAGYPAGEEAVDTSCTLVPEPDYMTYAFAPPLRTYHGRMFSCCMSV